MKSERISVEALPESKKLAQTFVDLAHTINLGADRYEAFSLLSEKCVEVLPVSASGILLKDQSGVLQVIAASNPSAHLLELFQIQNAEGPCYKCSQDGALVSDETLDLNGPWPKFSELARAKGFTATYAIPLRSKGQFFGALNLFAKEKLAIDKLAIAQTLADAATLTILHLNPNTDKEFIARNVQTTIQERNIIEQAKGMISQRFNCDVDEAFLKIKEASQTTDSFLIEVAKAIVDRDKSHPSYELLKNGN